MTRRVEHGQPLRLAYADPPYPKKAHLYEGHRDYAGEVDHRALCSRLLEEFPDGFALSTSAEALPTVLEYLPRDVRVNAWLRGIPTSASARRPLTSWEPVIVYGGRSYDPPRRVADSLEHGVAVRSTDPEIVIGAKPAAFIWWLFELLGALPGDELVDLFPGSGGISRAWERYSSPDVGLDA